MDLELPKLIFRQGSEPQVEKINNRCTLAILTPLKAKLENEYNKVLKDPVFGPIVAICENGLGYSARLIHTFMCKQLITNKKHELWFVFAGRPLRFSLQEFHAVTGLNYKDTENCNFEKWTNDDGFWSNLLLSNKGISIKKIIDKHLDDVHNWKREDRLRLVYLFVITGLVMAQSTAVNIPQKYIKMVMDIGQLQKYPWGRHSFELLVENIIKARVKLSHPKGYTLDGFSVALQIWIMEAIKLTISCDNNWRRC